MPKECRIDERISKIFLIAQREGVPEEQVGQNWGLVVTVRAAAKRQLGLTNHIEGDCDIDECNTLALMIGHQSQLNKKQEARLEYDELIAEIQSSYIKGEENKKCVWG